ncbi:MAG: hypothetical protein KJ800_00795, partial [Proteobacteria bacterium]|nr:hypothetical protein [Pseudomonadota bacterium]
MTETSGAKPVSQAKTNLTTVDSLLQELSDSGLSKFLRDKATADRIARYVAKETGYKLVYIRLAMRLITPLVVNLAEAGGRWIGGIALMRLKSILEHSDWCRNCLNYLKTLAEKTAGQANA